MRILAIDFETADFEAESACALGLVSVSDGKIVDRRGFLIKPPRNSFTFTYLHGISWLDVENERTFKERWAEISNLVKTADILAAHNAGFDRKVLYSCCSYYGVDAPVKPFLCTVKLARALWNLRPTTLPDVCRHLDIQLDHHNAAADALACAKIIQAAISDGQTIEVGLLRPPSYTIHSYDSHRTEYVEPGAPSRFEEGKTAHNSGDYILAMQKLKPLAERGDTGAQELLGRMHEFGEGVTKDYGEAAKWYRRAAWQGSCLAQEKLGRMYAGGRGVGRDYFQAYLWLVIAALGGSGDAEEDRNMIAKKIPRAQITTVEMHALDWWKKHGKK